MSSELEKKTAELAQWIKEQPHLPQNTRKLCTFILFFILNKIINIILTNSTN